MSTFQKAIAIAESLATAAQLVGGDDLVKVKAAFVRLSDAARVDWPTTTVITWPEIEAHANAIISRGARLGAMIDAPAA